MRYNKFSAVIVFVLALVLFASSSFAQQGAGAQALVNQSAVSQVSVTPQTNRVSAVAGKSALSYSIHSRGFIGKYEVVTLRERGLWGNGCLTQLLVDRNGEPVAVLNSSASAGPGIAIVQGASFVGGMYLFAEHLRPNQENVNSNNSGGGTTVNNSNSANANGGVANATGGNSTSSATGGNANNTGAGSGQSVIVNSGAANGNGTINQTIP